MKRAPIGYLYGSVSRLRRGSVKQAVRRHAAVVAVVVVAVGQTACSSVPDELNPVSWVDAVTDAMRGDDTALSAEDQARAEAERAQSVPGEGEPFPSLGSVPDAPPEVTPEEERQAIAQGLIADRANAQYSEPVSLPESVMTPPSVAVAESATPVAAVEPLLPAAAAQIGEGSADPESPEPPAIPVASEPPATVAAAPEPASGAPVETAAVAPPPPPPPSPPPPPPRTPTPPVTAAPQPQIRAAVPPPPPPPPAMARPAPPAPRPAATYSPAPERRLDGGFRPLAQFDPQVIAQSQQAGVIYFAHGSAKLSREDRQVLGQIAAALQAYGGSIRVIGHSSGRSGFSDVAHHQSANYTMSMKRAQAVARELARLGVDPAYIYVGGAADADPRYSEATKMGEAANRRADIFLDYWRRG